MSYTRHDAERFIFEIHTSSRSPYARDRARIIHSSAWRRLAAKTQVLSPVSVVDFARNRLTHSLEVAQIGAEVATELGLEANIVDAACLAHDLGHPPFGHNGERALDKWIFADGGFEGNAQTLRILARLEPKKFDETGASVGLNLTRAMLDASCKYPWSREEVLDNSDINIGRSPKFGYFEDDREIFEWFRIGASAGQKSVEAQVMDLADDIAYSVHDYEDAILNGFIDPELLVASSGHDKLLAKISTWSNNEFQIANLEAAYVRISEIDSWVTSWSGSMRDQAKLKNFTSDIIGRFARGAVEATRQAASTSNLSRYGANIVVPEWVAEEIAVLKGLVAAYVMDNGKRQPFYEEQRQLLTELLDALWLKGAEHLEVMFKNSFETATSEAEARRVIVDQVASLTDQGAITWHEKFHLNAGHR